jgi:hypothetical protein
VGYGLPKNERAMPATLRLQAPETRESVPHPLLILHCVWTRALLGQRPALGSESWQQPEQNGISNRPVSNRSVNPALELLRYHEQGTSARKAVTSVLSRDWSYGNKARKKQVSR